MKSLLFSLNANQQKIELAYISCLMEMCELWRLISALRWQVRSRKEIYENPVQLASIWLGMLYIHL